MNNGAAVAWSEMRWQTLDNLEKQSAAEIGRLIAKGDLDPVEVAEFLLGRIERDRQNPSFIAATRDRALRIRYGEEAARDSSRRGPAITPAEGRGPKRSSGSC
jgi:Asp-tRNA(Asn)/Glu-tRNA(Gln) amidotransferase A subunit family amidase